MTLGDFQIGYPVLIIPMLTTESLLKDSPRDAATILAALLVVGRHRVAIAGAMSALADFHGQFRDRGNETAARTMADATEYLLKDQATIEMTIAELVEIGGSDVAEWEATSRASVRKQLETREAASELMALTGQYLKLAINVARIDRLEADYVG